MKMPWALADASAAMRLILPGDNKNMAIAALPVFLAAHLSMALALDFKSQTALASKAFKCPDPKISRFAYGYGAEYKCTAGRAKTVTLFINEADGYFQPTDVASIKLLWRDRLRDNGSGLHADRTEAQRFVATFSKLYAPELGNKLKRAFFADTDKTFTTPNYRISYSFGGGRGYNERLLLLRMVAPPNSPSNGE
jgi:hypothetical protein